MGHIRAVRRSLSVLSVVAVTCTPLAFTSSADGATHRCLGKRATVVGSPAADTLRGTRHADVIVALGGADKISGGGGADLICAGPGDDTVLGGAGPDRISAGRGADTVATGSGNNVASGDTGSDIILGGAGNDRLLGGADSDAVLGDRGNDTLDGGPGVDLVAYLEARGGVIVDLSAGLATAADDAGQSGRDTLTNLEGVIGSDFGDYLFGSSDTDAFFAGAGDDYIDAETGQDFVFFTLADGPVTADLDMGLSSGADGVDNLIGVENLIGSQYDDLLIGNSSGNYLNGDLGHDQIDGQHGEDVCLGEELANCPMDLVDHGDTAPTDPPRQAAKLTARGTLTSLLRQSSTEATNAELPSASSASDLPPQLAPPAGPRPAPPTKAQQAAAAAEVERSGATDRRASFSGGGLQCVPYERGARLLFPRFNGYGAFAVKGLYPDDWPNWVVSHVLWSNGTTIWVWTGSSTGWLTADNQTFYFQEASNPRESMTAQWYDGYPGQGAWYQFGGCLMNGVLPGMYGMGTL